MRLNLGQIIIQSILQLIPALLLFWRLYLIIAIVVVVKVCWLLHKNHILRKAGMPEIDRMSGDVFEKKIGMLFEKMGYKVQYVGSHRGDFGSDLVIEKDGIRTVVQAKRHAHYIDGDAVREAYAARNMYQATKAMVVTNNYFSKAAKQLAASDDVELWDRDELARRVLRSRLS
ncbi:hypothetical protein BH09PAT2_BH09PAT2_04590 [soil metagenome]